MLILRAFYKIFNTFDNKIVEQCQYYMDCLPMKLLVDVRKLNEHDKIIMNINHPMHNIFSLMANNEYHSICAGYNVTVLNPKRKRNAYRNLIWTFFESRVSR